MDRLVESYPTGDPGDACRILGPIAIMQADLEENQSSAYKLVSSEDQRQSLGCTIQSVVYIISNRAIGSQLTSPDLLPFSSQVVISIRTNSTKP